MRILITLVLAAICALVLVVGLAGSFARQHSKERTIPLRVGTTPLPLNEAIRLVLERSQEMGS